MIVNNFHETFSGGLDRPFSREINVED